MNAMTKKSDKCKGCLRDQCPLHCPALGGKKPEQNPQPAPEAGSECMNLLSALRDLAHEWNTQADFLDNPHDHKEDRAIGKTYRECADILKSRFSI
jgi:hypothetical protein